jgi:hypothetical protein
MNLIFISPLFVAPVAARSRVRRSRKSILDIGAERRPSEAMYRDELAEVLLKRDERWRTLAMNTRGA